MGVLRHCHRRHHHLNLSIATITALTLLLFACATTAFRLNHPTQPQLGARRLLGGPGSWPPSCRAKCGRCYPCKPVHVPIQPGFSTPLEYYPEAWRCKCGNKLFMP